MPTLPCNVDLLTPHFYTVKLSIQCYDICLDKTKKFIILTVVKKHNILHRRVIVMHTCDIILDANREVWALKSYFCSEIGRIFLGHNFS